MKCPREIGEDAELLSYSALRLEGSRADELEAHLEACAVCREFVAEQRSVWQALDGWEAAPVTADFDRRLYGRIEQEGNAWDSLLRPLRWLTLRHAVPVAAAACLLVVAGWMVEQRPARVVAPPPTTARAAAFQADQVEHALDDMNMLSDFTRTTRSDAADF